MVWSPARPHATSDVSPCGRGRGRERPVAILDVDPPRRRSARGSRRLRARRAARGPRGGGQGADGRGIGGGPRPGLGDVADRQAGPHQRPRAADPSRLPARSPALHRRRSPRSAPLLRVRHRPGAARPPGRGVRGEGPPAGKGGDAVDDAPRSDRAQGASEVGARGGGPLAVRGTGRAARARDAGLRSRRRPAARILGHARHPDARRQGAARDRLSRRHAARRSHPALRLRARHDARAGQVRGRRRGLRAGHRPGVMDEALGGLALHVAPARQAPCRAAAGHAGLRPRDAGRDAPGQGLPRGR